MLILTVKDEMTIAPRRQTKTVVAVGSLSIFKMTPTTHASRVSQQCGSGTMHYSVQKDPGAAPTSKW